MTKKPLIAAVVGFLALYGQDAIAQDDKPVADCVNSVVVNFPTTGPLQTQWALCYEVVNRHGLIIRHANFRPSPLAPQIIVLNDARISEIFVPYHSGAPRFYDVSRNNFSLLQLSTNDCPASVGGTLLASRRICQQIRDRGVAWKHHAKVRRGEELVLWGVLRASNYNYIIEWTFQDDGTFKGQVGSTGPTKSDEGHMHNFTWRLDIDVNGSGGDTVHRTRHRESTQTETDTGTSATDEELLVSIETSLVWSPTEFTTWEVTDATLKNSNGRRTAYELIPLRWGTARHREAVTKKDLWVTRYKPDELLSVHLLSYLNGETVKGQDIVLWYTGSVHHEDGMRDEDSDTTPVKWVGFTLEPKNMFSGTPMYP